MSDDGPTLKRAYDILEQVAGDPTVPDYTQKDILEALEIIRREIGDLRYAVEDERDRFWIGDD